MQTGKTKNRRLGVYLGLLAVLALLVGIAVWSVARTGAWLTDEGDWQTLDGAWNYRIGTIDYHVSINGQTLIELDSQSRKSLFYEMVVPQRGGVRMFDPTVEAALRTAEFNEGVTLARVKVENRSDSPVEVFAAITVLDDDGGRLRVLPLNPELTGSINTLDFRAFALSDVGFVETSSSYDAAGETAALNDFTTSYDARYNRYEGEGANRHRVPMELSLGVIPGVTTDSEGKKVYASTEFCLLVWSEYDGGSYNSAVTGSDETARTGRLQAVFTVGQLE